ncbi:MAG: nucleotidyltransferase family protein [Nitrosopumilus sp. B06]|nr:MAG: nucleotidyltransferase family protein [Nitrosopumilus sp. D6]RNJ79323.1 MAG: nucleotidyltransferase family protein [Nitrosopumilus sp. B06]
MKAVILAGGSGTRGRPYTEYFPKAMIPVNGRPLIDHIVGYLRTFSFIGEIVIIADFEGLGAQIRGYYGRQKGITFVQDSQSGTGGDLVHAESRLGEEFVLWFVDNLCAIDLDSMKETFHGTGSAVCIATRKKRREETGFAEVRDKIVTKFSEKPVLELPISECLGIYMMNKEVIRRVRSVRTKKVNLSYDVLQQLAGEGRVGAFDIGDTRWMDVESPMILERRKKDVAHITKLMGS